MDQEIDIPSYFLCPISLDIMKDPVTVPTGITYDRESIERWIYAAKNTTCPATKQPLSAAVELTPNHTLRRLIQAWCTLNAVDRIPTPKPPVTHAQVSKMISRAHQGGRHLTAALREMKSVALESAANRRALESAGAVQFLSAVVNDSGNEDVTVDLAVSVLAHLHISENNLAAFQNGAVLIGSLTRIIHERSSDESVRLLKWALEAAQPIQLAGLRPELFSGLIRLIKEGPVSSGKTMKAAMKILIQVCPWGRNRVKAVEAGAVAAMVDVLFDGGERRVAEMAMVVVEQLCGCAEGRAGLVAHGGGLAVVSKKIMRVSALATERAVRALWAVAKYSAEEGRVVREMAEVGVVAKLCLVLQVECDSKTKERVKEILKMHGGVWKDSPCVPSAFVRSYPSL